MCIRDRFIGAFRAGNIDDHDMIAVDFLHKYILGGQHIHAGLVGDVYKRQVLEKSMSH